jgi:AraC-like DNA-binding protein
MEFSVHALTAVVTATRQTSDSSADRQPETTSVPSTSGLQMACASARTPIAFSAIGCLILALRQPVLLKIGEQELVIPKFGAYFVPPAERQRTTSASSQILGAEPPIVVQAHSDGPWLMISASEVTWRVLSGELRRMGATHVQPVAGLWQDSTALAKWALRTIRRARATPRSTLEPIMLFELAQAFQTALTDFVPWIERCPGRWQTQKFQVFRRLMRVRQYIDLRCTDSLPIERLAGIANYSRAHFMTVFRHVFGETPHARLLDRRLMYAQRKLGQDGLSVQETTLAAGFEDRSSFSKLFRRRFGVTALATRQAAVHRPAGNTTWGRLILL